MIQFSSQESEIMGYRIARGDKNSIHNISLLKQELETQKIDVLKLSIKSPEQDLFIQLDKLELPYYQLGTILEFKSFFVRNPIKKEYLHKNLTFKEFSLSDTPMLSELVNKIFENDSSSFFINPALKDIDQKSKLIKCLTQYICSYCKEIDSSKYTHIMYNFDIPIGFITSYKEGSGGGVLYAGILKEYVGKGYYIDLVRFIQNYGKSIGQKWGLACVQIHNRVVQKTFIREGLVPHNYIVNVHINSRYGKLKP